MSLWNSLPDSVLVANSVNIFKSRLYKFWSNQNLDGLLLKIVFTHYLLSKSLDEVWCNDKIEAELREDIQRGCKIYHFGMNIYNELLFVITQKIE